MNALLLVAAIAYGSIDLHGCIALSTEKLTLPAPAIAAFFDPPHALAISVITNKNCPDGYQAANVETESIGIGIVMTGGPYTALSPTSDGAVRIRNRAGTIFILRQCASSEGLHLTVWKGAERVWHDYYALGYDVEPTCTDEETRE